MQVEVISALIGAAVALPASGVAYAVGRHQAAATISAARTQAAAGQKQWRDNNRRAAWLAFVRSVDEVSEAVDGLVNGRELRGTPMENFAAELKEKLADVEFEGPAEIWRIGQCLVNDLTERALLSVFIRPYANAQHRFDGLLAEAQQGMMISVPSDASNRFRRLIRAGHALEALSGARNTAPSLPPSDSLMETAMLMMSPFIQSAGREAREPLSRIARGVVSLVLTATRDTPVPFYEAQRVLRECDEFSDEEIAALLVGNASRMIPSFEGLLGRSRNSFREARRKFIQETDKHLDARLPVRRQ
ncbi:hypothetical protein OG521_25975 [Streptomyces sp. NBC_01463]